MGSDLDYAHPEVKEDVLAWGKWLAKEIPLRGIRFDAIKHYDQDFLRKFVAQMDESYGEGWFFVGEFWKDSLDDLVCFPARPVLFKAHTTPRKPSSTIWATSSRSLTRR